MTAKSPVLHERTPQKIRAELLRQKESATNPLSRVELRGLALRVQAERSRERRFNRVAHLLRRATLACLAGVFFSAYLPEGYRGWTGLCALGAGAVCLYFARRLERSAPADVGIQWLEEQLTPLSHWPGVLDEVKSLAKDSHRCDRYLNKVRDQDRPLVFHDYDVLLRLQRQLDPLPPVSN